MPLPTPRSQELPAHPTRRWLTWSLVIAGYVAAVGLGVMGRSNLAGATLGVALIATVKQVQSR